jgi:Uncharacterised nucleotidyltransferase
MTLHPARLLLETLRFQNGTSAAQLAADWAEVDGRGLDRLVVFEGCGSWLYRRLRQIGAVADLDLDFRDWLAELTREETARNLIVDAEAREIATLLTDLGVPGVFLKGVARRVSVDRYPLADARLTNDVDVLVPADRAREVWDELRRRGYQRTKPSRPPRPEHHHLPALMCARRVGVEVHTTTNARRIAPAEAWRRLYGTGVEVRRDGVCYRVPSATELFWGGAAHGLLHPDNAFVLVLLFSSAVIWAGGGGIDWADIRGRLETKEIVDGAAARAWLSAASQLVGAEPPPELAGVLAPYDLNRALALRLAVLRHVPLPEGLWKGLAWWSSDRARRA